MKVKELPDLNNSKIAFNSNTAVGAKIPTSYQTTPGASGPAVEKTASRLN